jgi:hypothetical protein
MSRYSDIAIYKKILENSSPLLYANVKYPKITLDPLDIYVYITQGDRYDTLAQTYYEDSSLWWIINRANPSQRADSLYPAVGSQVRIPSPDSIYNILAEYATLNGTSSTDEAEIENEF